MKVIHIALAAFYALISRPGVSTPTQTGGLPLLFAAMQLLDKQEAAHAKETSKVTSTIVNATIDPNTRKRKFENSIFECYATRTRSRPVNPLLRYALLKNTPADELTQQKEWLAEQGLLCDETIETDNFNTEENEENMEEQPCLKRQRRS
jgi:hypothetical protein